MLRMDYFYETGGVAMQTVGELMDELIKFDRGTEVSIVKQKGVDYIRKLLEVS